MTKVIVVIAEKNFQDVEYGDTRKALEKAGIIVRTASKTHGIKKGVFGEEVEVDFSFKEVYADDFEAIVFIGGGGAQKYINDGEATELARDFFDAGKITAAICIGPLILASSGILKGKKATVWDDGEGTQIKMLEGAKAEFVDEDVVLDGNIITANGPNAAKAFGKAIAEALR